MQCKPDDVHRLAEALAPFHPIGRALACFLLLLTLAPAARADEASDKAEAQRLLTKGNQAAGEGDYLTALDSFQVAYARYPSAKILLNIGTTLRLLGRHAEASEVYERYQRDPRADAGRLQEVNRALVEIEALVARLRIVVNKPGAAVRLDGRALSAFQNGVVLRVEPGEHTVVADLQGFPPAVVTLRVNPREQRDVALELTQTPQNTVVVERLVTGPQRIVGGVIGGVGLAGLAAGGVLGGVAISKNHAAAQYCYGATSCDAEGVALSTTARSFATGSTVAVVAGGALTVTGLVVFLTAPAPRRTTTTQIVTGLSPLGPSLHLEGAW